MNRGIVSYSHNDKKYFKYLVNGLKVHSTYFKKCNWQIWDDSHIILGSNWHNEIQKRIVECEFALLLISADFFNSEYIKNNELGVFLELANNRGFRIFPILIRDINIKQIKIISQYQFFKAYGEDYGISIKKEQLISYSELFRFDNNGVMIPNPYVDTYHKNLVEDINKGLSLQDSFDFKSNNIEKEIEYVHTRRENIEDKIVKLSGLLNEWESKRDFSDNPTEILRCKTEVDRIKKLICSYSEELSKL